ncbi:MAG: class I SAM-dependent methyltransferase [Opitutaceae bacterium]
MPFSCAHPTGSRDQFEFGKNWRAFLSTVDEQSIRSAESSLVDMLSTETLQGKRFLDVGCGSGLFSLAARNLGAVVHSFDYDRAAVACTEELKRRFRATDNEWTIQEGSVLNSDYLSSLGTWDVVYSWGVLHHTGDLWRALDLVPELVGPRGQLFIAIYNDQGGTSRRWLRIKRLYNRLPSALRPMLVFLVAAVFESYYALVRLMRGRNPLPFSDWQQKKRDRGMSAWHDWVDWVGGLPFQVAKPEQIVVPLRQRGFVLDKLVTCLGGHACNQYVLQRVESV